mgnify:CR=1 FL=1
MGKRRPAWIAGMRRAAWGGGVNVLVSLALVLTIGLVAFSALGEAAAPVGIAASFAAVIAGGFVYALLAMLAFGCASAAVYFVNDVADVERDRRHPRGRTARGERCSGWPKKSSREQSSTW